MMGNRGVWMNFKTILMILIVALFIGGLAAELTGNEEQLYQDSEFFEFADSSFQILNADLDSSGNAVESGDYMEIYSVGLQLHDHAQSALIECNDYEVSEQVEPIKEQFYETVLDYSTTGSFMKSAAENMEAGNMIKANEDFELATISLEKGRLSFVEYEKMNA